MLHRNGCVTLALQAIIYSLQALLIHFDAASYRPKLNKFRPIWRLRQTRFIHKILQSLCFAMHFIVVTLPASTDIRRSLFI